ncbi:MAG: MotA/TolQ/ExbB proton channel family protein [Aquificota bacterium]|nr:MAG: MotA/TolQ/ExbB proton channel family protein [Aquificota bacterium]
MYGITEEKMDYIVSVFQKGGVIMYPLLLLGILSIAFIIERFYSLSYRKVIPVKDVESVFLYLKEGRLTEAITTAKVNDSLATKIIANILDFYMNGRVSKNELELAAEEVAKVEIPKMESYVNFLGAIAAIAPLLGFLGTVTGMIQVFEALSLEGLTNPAVLSSGISQALLTTAFGLTIAIPSLAAYWYFKSKLTSMVAQLENIANDLIYLLSTGIER